MFDNHVPAVLRSTQHVGKRLRGGGVSAHADGSSGDFEVGRGRLEILSRQLYQPVPGLLRSRDDRPAIVERRLTPRRPTIEGGNPSVLI